MQIGDKVVMVSCGYSKSISVPPEFCIIGNIYTIQRIDVFFSKGYLKFDNIFTYDPDDFVLSDSILGKYMHEICQQGSNSLSSG